MLILCKYNINSILLDNFAILFDNFAILFDNFAYNI